MEPDRQDNTRALRARRKAEQVGLYANGTEAGESKQQAYQPYVDVHPIHHESRREETRHKPYGDPNGRTEGNAGSSNQILESLEAIKTRKLLIVCTAVVGAVGGIISLIPESPIYEAGTTLEIMGFNESFMNMNQVDPQAGTGNYSPNQLNLTTQMRIIESATLRSAVYDAMQREITPVMKPQVGFMAKLRGRYGEAAKQDPLEYTKNALAMAIESLYARSVTGTRIISINTESTSPEVAANVVNAVADEYIQQYGQDAQRSTNSQKMATYLDGQVEEAKVRLAKAESALNEFMRNSGTVFAPNQDTLATSKLRQVQGNLSAIVPDLIAKEAKYRAVQNASSEALPEILGDAGLRDIQNKLSVAKEKRAQLLTTLTPKHPKVEPVDVDIAFLEREYEKAKNNAISKVKSDYETARQQEQMLRKEYGGATGAVISQADKGVQYTLLNREAEILRGQLQSLLQHQNQANATSALPTNNVRIIDRARPPSIPSKPNSFQRVSSDMILGAAFGCMIALARAKYLKSRSSRKFAEPGHAAALLQVPELGVIPSASFRISKKNRWAIPWKRGDPRLLPNGGPSQVGEGETDLMALLGTPSLLADSFRLMVVSITLMNKDSRANSFVVTSPGPAEGKTTLISNLAVVMAETGRKVLLIDMDLRKPRLHHIFGVDNSRGFSDLIKSDAPMDPVTIEEFIQPTKMPGVSIIPSGVMMDLKSINQLFYSPRVAAFMKIVRQMVDIVLIDAPPMMQFSEARLMASMADQVILVLRSGSTDRETALACQRRLAEDGANLLGTILNDWNPSNSNLDYNSYYSYYHHQVEEQ